MKCSKEFDASGAAYPPFILVSAISALGWGAQTFFIGSGFVDRAECAGAATFLKFAGESNARLFI